MAAGWLAPIPPHIYRHIKESRHVVLHELAQPVSLRTVARRANFTYDYLLNYVLPEVRDELHLEQPGRGNAGEWRVALTRLYYGIDRCWCQS